jgi:guanylate kinase
MVFVIDQQGARQFKARVPEAVGVFILPPSLAVLERGCAGAATDNDGVGGVGGSRDARVELMHYGLFDYVVVNDDLDAASAELDGHRGGRARAALAQRGAGGAGAARRRRGALIRT